MEKEKIISVMKRYELKYYLNKQQLSYFMEKLNGHMKVDKYGLTSIASLYFDTPDYRLINRSIEKPKYKEKLRLRSYGLAKENSKTFLEIKRKCDGIVYKRRISLLEKEAAELIKEKESSNKNQINRELVAFLENYQKVEPKYLNLKKKTKKDFLLKISHSMKCAIKPLKHFLLALKKKALNLLATLQAI